jgi:hypothetical protein
MTLLIQLRLKGRFNLGYFLSTQSFLHPLDAKLFS